MSASLAAAGLEPATLAGGPCGSQPESGASLLRLLHLLLTHLNPTGPLLNHIPLACLEDNAGKGLVDVAHINSNTDNLVRNSLELRALLE